MEQQQRLAQEQQRLIQEQQRLAQEQHQQATAREDALRAALQTERDTNAENQKKMNDQTVQHLQLSVAHEQEKAVTDKARVEEAAAITRQLLSEKDSKFASVTSEQAARIADLKEQRETQAAQTAINQFQHQQAMLNQQQFALNLSTTLLTCSSGRPISTQPTADQPSADITQWDVAVLTGKLQQHGLHAMASKVQQENLNGAMFKFMCGSLSTWTAFCTQCRVSDNVFDKARLHMVLKDAGLTMPTT